jgi:hypothetical protein
VLDHGATAADDGIDERPMFASAIAAACARPNLLDRQVYVPAGNYTFRRPPIGVTDSIRLTCDGLRFFGDGQFATVLEQYGTGMLPTEIYEPRAWKLLHVVNATATAPCPKGVVISDLTVAGGERTFDTEEQTHLLETGCSVDAVTERVTAYIPQRPLPAGSVACQIAPDGTLCERPNHGDHTPVLCHTYVDTSVSPPVTRVGLNRAVCSVSETSPGQFTWTLLGWWGGGDCFRYFSEPAIPVRNATLRNAHGVDCDRAGISGQRGVEGLLVEDSDFRCDNDTPWDFEATGGGGLKGVVARGVTLSRGDGVGGGYTKTIGGNGDSGLTDETYDCGGRWIEKGGVSILDVSKVTIVNCKISSGLASFFATLDIRKRGIEIEIRDSLIVRPAGSPPLPVVNVRHHTGVSPRLVKIVNTELRQETVAPIIDAQSLGILELVNVKMVYAAAPWDPATNPTETAFVIADTVLGSPRRADTVSMSRVTVEAPPGSVATLIRMSTTTAWPQRRGVIMADVTVSPGALRNALVRFNGPTTAKGKLYSTGVSHNAPAVCIGPSC